MPDHEKNLTDRLTVKARPEGFERRFVASEPRLSEAIDTYRELGYEVALLPAELDPEPGQDCTECLAGSFVIFTRPAEGPMEE